jgi:diguanylate cyclase (GGDEF)-like protein
MTELSQKKRKVLTIDDNQTNLAVSKVHLERMGLDVLLADNSLAGIETAVCERPDLILLDIMMPDIDGYEACRRLKADSRTANIPIIFLSAKGQTTDKIAGLELGAIEYIAKPFDPGEFRARINIILQMISLQEKLLSQANTDELTGVANRRCFNEMVDREVLHSRESGSPLSLLMLDIDHFKKINDTYGHLGGDIILRQLAELLKENVRPMDIVSRYGGEEFVLTMADTDWNQAEAAAEKLRRFAECCRWKVSAEKAVVTVSIGLVTMDVRQPCDAEELVRRADAALYLAKQNGRNCVVRWDNIQNLDEDPLEENEEFKDIRDNVSRIMGSARSGLVDRIFELIKSTEETACYPGHSVNVLAYAQAIAGELSLPPEAMEHLSIAAKFHDLGSMSIPREILTKPAPLSARERHIINQHTLISVQILEPIGMFRNELPIIRHHHERFDGKGYPDGLRSQAIPFGARILAVAETFDGITAERTHRENRTMDEAVVEIRRHSGTQFDPQIVEAFEKAAARHAHDWPLVPQPAMA